VLNGPARKIREAEEISPEVVQDNLYAVFSIIEGRHGADRLLIFVICYRMLGELKKTACTGREKGVFQRIKT